MLGALIVTSLLESFGLGPRPMACDFPASEAANAPMLVEVRARPSLKDQRGLYRALMSVEQPGEVLSISAAAQPLLAENTTGILIRGRADEATHYVVGVDTEGAAALSVTWGDRDPPVQMTRIGKCRNHASYIRRWAQN